MGEDLFYKEYKQTLLCYNIFEYIHDHVQLAQVGISFYTID